MACAVTVVRQRSKTRCEPGISFGASDNPLERRMWVEGGCRGVFSCCDQLVACGNYARPPHLAMDVRETCACGAADAEWRPSASLDHPCLLLMHFHFKKSAGTELRHVFTRGALAPIRRDWPRFHAQPLDYRVGWWASPRQRAARPLVYAEAHLGYPWRHTLQEVHRLRHALRQQNDSRCTVLTVALLREPAAQIESGFRYFALGKARGRRLISASEWIARRFADPAMASPPREPVCYQREGSSLCGADCGRHVAAFNRSVLARLDEVAPVEAFSGVLLEVARRSGQRLTCSAFVREGNACCPSGGQLSRAISQCGPRHGPRFVRVARSHGGVGNWGSVRRRAEFAAIASEALTAPAYLFAARSDVVAGDAGAKALLRLAYARKAYEVERLRPHVACSSALYSSWADAYAASAAARWGLVEGYCREHLACARPNGSDLGRRRREPSASETGPSA